VDREDVVQWVADYERAWRTGDVSAVPRLFTENVSYRRSPYAEPDIGHEGILSFWLDDEGRTFSVQAEPVAVEGYDAVVRLTVRYREPVDQEYRDLWVLHFAPDGRVEDFEEWAYWPGKPFSAGGDTVGGQGERRVTRP
jgi:SnoaL-like domain